MATVEHEQVEAEQAPSNLIEVENPGTGEIIATVPELDAAAVAELAARGRAAQPHWESYGFEGRARVMLGPRSGSWTTQSGSRRRSSPRPARPGRTPSLRRSATPATPSASGPRKRRRLPRRRESRAPARSSCSARNCILRHRPLGLIGVIGPWNYPLHQLRRRLHPGDDGRQQRDPQAERVHASDLAADRRRPARVRTARGRASNRDRPRRDRTGADRRTSTW